MTNDENNNQPEDDDFSEEKLQEILERRRQKRREQGYIFLPSSDSTEETIALLFYEDEESRKAWYYKLLQDEREGKWEPKEPLITLRFSIYGTTVDDVGISITSKGEGPFAGWGLNKEINKELLALISESLKKFLKFE